MRVLVAVGAVAALFAVVAVAAQTVEREPRLRGGTVLPVGEDVTAEVLADGWPVFVAPQRDGSVAVLSALNPHLDHRVVWCPSSRTSYELGPASIFDERGHWLGGPSAYGLFPYEVTEVHLNGERHVHVGNRRDPPRRDARPLRPSGPLCEVVHDHDTSRETMLDGVEHDLEALYGPPQPPEGVDRNDRLVRLEARIARAADGDLRLCSRHGGTGCPPGSPAVRSTWSPLGWLEEGWTGHRDSEVLARAAPLGFHDVAVLFEDVLRSDYTLTEAWDPDDDPVVYGVLVGVEGTPEGLTAVLAEPVAVLQRDGDAPDARFDPSARWPLAEDASLWHEERDDGLGRLLHGEPLPQRVWYPDGLAALLAEEAPLPAELTLDLDGVVRGGSLAPIDREGWQRRHDAARAAAGGG